VTLRWDSVDFARGEAAAVGGLVGNIRTDGTVQLDEEESDRLVNAANIVTYARTAVERDDVAALCFGEPGNSSMSDYRLR